MTAAVLSLVQSWDAWLNAALAPLRHPWLLEMFKWLTAMGEESTAVAVAVVASGLLASGGRRWLVAPMWATLAGAEAVTWSVKFLANRARPAFLDGITAASPSFPSAHATVAAALYGFLGLAVASGLPNWRRTVLGGTVAFAGLIGWSRLFLNLHYLSDVIGGYLAGGGALWLGWRWARMRGTARGAWRQERTSSKTSCNRPIVR